MNAIGTNGYKWPLPVVYAVQYIWQDYGRTRCMRRLFQSYTSARKWKPVRLKRSGNVNFKREIREYKEDSCV